MDIGCGSGIISLILAKRYPDLKITGIEIQEQLYTFARQNIIANHLEKNIQILHDNIKNIKFSETDTKADIIVSNPPYKKLGTGRLNPDSQKAMARHETAINVDTLVECACRLIRDQGLLYIIFPFDRLSDLTKALSRHRFFPEWIRHVHIKEGTKATRVVVRAVNNENRQCSLLPPFFFYTRENKFSEDYLSLFRT